jgi:hypothetical protein
MEGKFCREGLQALEEDDDMLTAMARELVTENGVGESADVIWRQIQAEHGKNAPFVTPEPEVASVSEDGPLTIPSAASMLVAENAPKFGSRPPTARPLRRRDDPPLDAQFALF